MNSQNLSIQMTIQNLSIKNSLNSIFSDKQSNIYLLKLNLYPKVMYNVTNYISMYIRTTLLIISILSPLPTTQKKITIVALDPLCGVTPTERRLRDRYSAK